MVDSVSNSTLTPKQRSVLLTAIQHRTKLFQRDSVIAKLTAADKSYHMANVRAESALTDTTDHYSRFDELDNALGREVAEAYYSYYVETFLGKSKVFSMTSHEDVIQSANAFNTILGDQDRRTSWKSNLTKFFIDCAKYNLGAVEVPWISRTVYSQAFDIPRAGEESIKQVASVWKGNAIKALDMYNVIFDTRVAPQDISTEGEFAGYIELHSQVRLFKLIQDLKTDGFQVYDKAPLGQPDWSVFNCTTATPNVANNLDYREPEVSPLGQADSVSSKDLGWGAHFGSSTTENNVRSSDYQVTKFYLRIVPSSYGIKGDTLQLWEIYVLDGTYVLATRLMDNAHGLIPVVFGQPDSDSLKYNTAGPMQVAIPYKKTVKQLMDRVLAGADRAIRGKALYDSKYIDKDKINTSIPDAQIPVKSIPSGRSMSDIYHQIDMQGDTTGLGQLSSDIHMSGMRAAGINNSQSGQFTKGNRTLEEYNDIQGNAVSKQYVRALILEATAMTQIKSILKLNILQYQEATKLYDPDVQQSFEISRQDLYKAEVDFVLADALMPTEYMLSPNVQQQMFATVQAMPQAFAKYDVAGMLVHILEQSSGVNLKQYEYTKEQLAAMQAQAATQPPPGAQ